MNTLDPLQKLVGTLRANLAQQTQRSDKSHGKSAPNSTNNNPAATALSTAELKASIRKSLQALGPLETPSDRRRARRIFLEWAVLGELGFELANSSHYLPMLDHISTALESDAQRTEELDQLLQDLSTSG